MIKLKENRKGYKKTKLGWIPEDWEVKIIKEISNTTSGGTPNTKIEKYWSGNILWMNSGELKKKKIYEVKGRISKLGLKNSSTKIIPENSVLIGLAGQGKTRGTVAINKISLCINQSIAAIICDSKICYYLYLYYNMDNRYYELRRLSTGDGGRGGLNLNLINNIQMPLPSIKEQQKITEILSTWDDAIEKTEKIIEAKQKFKKGLMQKIFSIANYELRITNNSKKDNIYDMKLIKLKYLIKEISVKNRKSKISNVLSVTNVNGFIRQEDQFERQVASKDLSNYKIVKKGQFAYNPSRINVGSIDLLETFENGIVSPIYVVFETQEDKLIKHYLKYFLETNLFKQQMKKYFSGSVRESLSFSGLSLIKILLPDIKQQNYFVDILLTLDNEINLLKKKLNKLQEQKKGLMQVLLTGNIRVNL